MTLDDEKRAKATPRRRRWRVLALIASLLIALLLAELLTRVVSPQRLGIPTQESFEGLSVPRPGLRGRDAAPGEFDTTITTNPQRFRGARPTAPQPPAGTLRIAVLGDSFTFGEGAEDDQTYPAQLEALLAKGRGVEVLNAGSRGTGTGEQALYYERWVATFAPRCVVLTVYGNDVEDDLARGLFQPAGATYRPRPVEERATADAQQGRLRRWTRSLPGYERLSQSSHLLAFARRLASQRLQRQRAEAFQPAASDPATDRFEREGLPLLRGELAWLAGKVREQGASLYVVFAPPRQVVHTQVEGEWAEATRRKALAIVATLQGACKELKLPFVDLSPALRARAQRSEALYYPRDGHCTPAGYRAMAEEVAAFLLRAGLPGE